MLRIPVALWPSRTSRLRGSNLRLPRLDPSVWRSWRSTVRGAVAAGGYRKMRLMSDGRGVGTRPSVIDWLQVTEERSAGSIP